MGYGISRRVRLLEGADAELVPRRSRCRGCGWTHVLLAARCLARRADAGEVIGVALEARAAGQGHRKIAAQLPDPVAGYHGTLAEVTLAGPVELLVARLDAVAPAHRVKRRRGRYYFTADAVTRDERDPVGEDRLTWSAESVTAIPALRLDGRGIPPGRDRSPLRWWRGSVQRGTTRARDARS